jgi:hypothetical protein
LPLFLVLPLVFVSVWCGSAFHRPRKQTEPY